MNASAKAARSFIAEKGYQLGLAERVDPQRTCLIIIDVQNDFCHPDGVFGRLGHDLSCMAPMERSLSGLLSAARAKNIRTIFVRATYDDAVVPSNLAEAYNKRSFKDSLCLEGSWGADWFGDIRPDGSPSEVVVTKPRFTAFWRTALDLYLRSNGIETVVITGVVTSGCVDSTARDAFFNDYRVVVVSDCVAEASQERHDASLRKLAQTFGVVEESAAVINAWAARPTRAAGWQKEADSSDLRVLVDRGKTALLLIDFQRDFCEPSGLFASQGEDIAAIGGAIANTKTLLQAARSTKMPVIHIKAEYGLADSSSVSLKSNASAAASNCCRPGTPGAEFVDDLRPLPHELVVVKHRFSAFKDTRLELVLRSNNIRNIIATGVATHCCVESTVRDACMKDFNVTIPQDCVASRGRMKHLHDASLEVMALYFAQVTDSKAIMSAWG